MPRQRVTLEVHPELIELARRIGQELGISTAAAVSRLLLAGLEAYAAGEADFDGYLQPAAQGRYRWTVEIEPNGLGGRIRDRLTIT